MSKRSNTFRLVEADQVEVTCLVDNYADRLEPSSQVAQRQPYMKNGQMLKGPIAEHGFSALVKVTKDTEEHIILFDAGVTETAAVTNMGALDIDPNAIEEIVLSHGHVDHTGGLLEVLRNMKRDHIKVIMHPHALRKRWIVFPDGQRTRLSLIDEESITKSGGEIVKIQSPYLICNELIAATGEIRRQTDFEKGFPLSFAEIEGKLQEDFETKDEQALVMNVRGKGLVIISGCGHAGIVNTALYATEFTGVENIQAIIGGFHLTGPIFEPFINKTVEMIKSMQPQYIIPCHCTGWQAIHTFANEMPSQYIHNVVGTTYLFGE